MASHKEQQYEKINQRLRSIFEHLTSSQQHEAPYERYILRSDWGTIQLPPQNTNLVDFLFQGIQSYPDRTALTDAATGTVWSYAQLNANIQALSRAFYHTIGVRKQQCIAVFAPNALLYPIVVYASNVLGAYPALINPIYNGRELLHHLADSDAVCIFTTAQLVERVRSVLPQVPSIKQIFTFDSNNFGIQTVSQLMESGRTMPEPPKVTIDMAKDVALMPFSSGTTSLPKGCQLSHQNLISSVLMYQCPHIETTVFGETVLCALPMFHIFSASVVLNLSLARACNIVIMEKFKGLEFCSIIEKFKITRCSVVPPMIIWLIKQLPESKKHMLDSIVTFGCGAAPLGFDTEAAFKKKFPWINIKSGYGLTESSPATSGHPIGKIRNGSAGRLLPSIELRLVTTEGQNIETHVKSGRSAQGEIWLRGPNIFMRYHNRPEDTAVTIDRDGWLHTGDLGEVDADGFLYIVGRSKQLLKVNGLQVAPPELEALLLEHPAVSDAAVIGVPHDKAGEVPRAYVVLSGDYQPSSTLAQAIATHIEQRVAPHKRLGGGVHFLPAIPKTASGKILHRDLVAMAKQTQGQ